MILKPGVPKLEDYNAFLNCNGFNRMATFSDHFLDSNKESLSGYSSKWVADPLHQWSRQWEYPFVYLKLKEFVKEQTGKNIKILDAGSGITFFPYFLNSEMGVEATCCDIDKSYIGIFEAINKNFKGVKFDIADITALPYEDESFDAVYCISVLEHMPDFNAVLSEFKRVLKKRGMLAVTFDISLDGTKDIHLGKAKELIGTLNKNFDGNAHFPELDKNILTTTHIKDKRLIPWGDGEKAPKLTCFCHTFIK